ncbi:urease accessory protein UreD [Actinomycetospora sp. NBC_00405]|uniref:urease accessory protein UreD n=1 Tax=Actinomycetospora sp. NBC_00405 TaxID=2975952 RepID=UPI002E2264FE
MDVETGDGSLEIDLVRRVDGRTGVAALVQRFPQRVTAPMYLDDDAPGAAYLCVQNPTGALFDGDHLRTRVHVGPGAGLQLGDQSATQVMPSRSASQRFAFRVDGGGVLEHIPHPVVPHRGATFAQDTEIDLRGDAVYLGWEILAPGRVGHGERFVYASVSQRLCLRCDGEPVARENLTLVPAGADPRTPGTLGAADHLATAVFAAPARTEVVEALAPMLTAALADVPYVRGAASPLPETVGVTVRVLATRAPALRAALRTAWALARRELLGRHRLPGRI